MKPDKEISYDDILAKKGRRYLGYFCSYVPEEIFHAAGYTPVRLLPRPRPLGEADAHLPVNTCSLARSCLELAFSKRGAGFSAFAFAHTCDTMQCLADIFRTRLLDKPVFNLIGPVNREASGAREFLLQQLEALIGQVNPAAERKITSSRLLKSIKAYNKLRLQLDQLHKKRRELPAVEFYRLVQAAMLLPKEEALELIKGSRAHREEAAPHALLAGGEEKPGIYLHGGMLYDPSLVSLIEDLGGRVAGDNLCSGTRYFNLPLVKPLPGEGPLEALADRYLKRLPCAAKHPTLDDTEGHLVRDVAESKAAGVVFLHDVFCEPHSWDLVILQNSLQSTGIPHITIEMDHMGVTEQIRGRLQAFMERLKGDL